MTSDDLSAHAQSTGHWKSYDGPVNFAKAFSANYEGFSLSDAQLPKNRLQSMKDLLNEASDAGKYWHCTVNPHK